MGIRATVGAGLRLSVCVREARSARLFGSGSGLVLELISWLLHKTDMIANSHNRAAEKIFIELLKIIYEVLVLQKN